MKIAIILTLMLIIQNGLTMLQIRSYQKRMENIIGPYKGKTILSIH